MPRAFVVTPTLTITDDGAVDTGMTTLHVLRADLTLSVKNLFEDTVFGSQTISLQANGKSIEAYAVADQQGERQRRAFRQADR